MALIDKRRSSNDDKAIATNIIGNVKNKSALIFDDEISTGGTLTAVINELKAIGVNLVDTVVVVEKGEGKGVVEEATGEDIKTLVKLDVVDGKVVADSLL